MGKLTGRFISVLLLLTALRAGLAENAYYGSGGTLQLRPKVSEKITSITWKHNNNLVAEWVDGKIPLQYYDIFLGPATLDTATGALDISNMIPAYDGVYTVEINLKVQSVSYTTKLILDVPKPTVDFKPLTCGPALSTCSMHCEVKSGETVTEEKYGPITYSWKMGAGEWEDGKKVRDIINDEKTRSFETFTCRINNLISKNESDPIENIFTKGSIESSSNAAGTVVGVLCGLLILAGLGGGGYFLYKRKKTQEFKPDSEVASNKASPQDAASAEEGSELLPCPDPPKTLEEGQDHINPGNGVPSPTIETVDETKSNDQNSSEQPHPTPNETPEENGSPTDAPDTENAD